MKRFVALLYSVILTAERRIKSAELLEAAVRAGFGNPRTVLITGNLIVSSDLTEEMTGRALERAMADIFGKSMSVFVRSADDFRRLTAANPFPEETAHDPSLVAARIMRSMPPADVIARISASTGPGERFAAGDRVLWLATADQLSTTRLLRAVTAPAAGEGTLRSASALAKIEAALSD